MEKLIKLVQKRRFNWLCIFISVRKLKYSYIISKFNMTSVGLIGFGYWGPNYKRVVTELGADLKYIADKDKKVFDKIPSNERSKISTTTEYSEVLKDPSVDAVVIATPTLAHYEIVRDAINAGKHVLVEKPLTREVKESEELVRLAKGSGLVAMVGHTFLFNDGIDYIKGMIERNELGQIYEIECSRKGLGPVRSDVGVLWDLATHDVSIVTHLLPNTKVKSVNARGFVFDPKRRSLEDAVNFTLNLENGTHASVHVNWYYPIKERLVTVVGSGRMIRFDDVNQQAPLTVYEKSAGFEERHYPGFEAFKMITKDGGTFMPPMRIKEPLKQEVAHFLDSIEKGKNPKSDLTVGLEIVRILEAAQRSISRRGQEVNLLEV